MKYSDYMADMQRDDEAVGSADLIVAYERGIGELQAAVTGMTAEQVLCRAIPGKWSTMEVVAHLADTEIYYTDRIERTIALERPLLMGVDERLYPDRLNYQAFDLQERPARHGMSPTANGPRRHCERPAPPCAVSTTSCT